MSRASNMASMIKLPRLRAARERAALSQGELAKKAGVSRVTIVRIEGGLDDPYPKTVRKIADALGVQPFELMAAEGAEA